MRKYVSQISLCVLFLIRSLFCIAPLNDNFFYLVPSEILFFSMINIEGFLIVFWMCMAIIAGFGIRFRTARIVSGILTLILTVTDLAISIFIIVALGNDLGCPYEDIGALTYISGCLSSVMIVLCIISMRELSNIPFLRMGNQSPKEIAAHVEPLHDKLNKDL